MGFSAKAGSFNLGTGAATTTTAVTGVGFTPKVVLFWWSGRTESVDTTNGSIDIKAGFGAMVGSSNRRCTTFQLDDAAATMATDRVFRNDACIASLTTAGATDGLADFSSFDGDGFTVVIDDAFATDLRVSYLALGGTDLTNVTTGTFTDSGATGNQDITGVGFQPDAVIVFGINDTATDNTPTAHGTFHIGAAAGSTPSNICFGSDSQDAVADSNNVAYARSGDCIGAASSGGDTFADGSITAWLSDGFRINWSDAGISATYYYVAFKGGSYKVGNVTTQTDTTTDIVASGFGFQPSAAFFISACRAESTAGTPTSGLDLSLGAFDSTSSRCAQGVQEQDATMAAEGAAALELDEVYVNISTADAVEGLMDIKSVDSGGFTCIMDDADPTANWVGYLAFGPSTASAALTGTMTAGVTEADIVAGGKTTIITLTGDTWIAAGAGSFDLQRDEIIAGHDSAQSEGTGWDADPKVNQSLGGVVRTSDTVVTVTWDAFPSYNITANETITVTVPATATVGGNAPVATPTFTISFTPTTRIKDMCGYGVVPWKR